MSDKREATKKKIIKAIPGTGGIVQYVANQAKLARQTVYEYMREYPEIVEALKEEEEKTKDLIEGKLITSSLEGNIKAIVYYLSTKGKDRGYSTKQEVEVSGGLVTKVVKGVDPEEV